MIEDPQVDATARWLVLAGLSDIVLAIAPTTEAIAKVIVKAGGLPWLVQKLAQREPVVLATTKCWTCQGSGWASHPTRSGTFECWDCGDPAHSSTRRATIMLAAISSVIVCLRRAREKVAVDKATAVSTATLGKLDETGLNFAADLLLERGHGWLGESLAMWLVGEHEKAVKSLIDRVPVLPEFAEWAREDAALRTHTSLRVRVDGQEQHVTFSFPRAHGKTAALAIVDDLNSQLAGVVARADGDTITLTSTATGSDVGSLRVQASDTQAPPARKPPPKEPWQVRAGARRERRRT